MGKGKPRHGSAPTPAPSCWLCASDMELDRIKEKKRVYFCPKCGTETEIRA